MLISEIEVKRKISLPFFNHIIKAKQSGLMFRFETITDLTDNCITRRHFEHFRLSDHPFTENDQDDKKIIIIIVKPRKR